MILYRVRTAAWARTGKGDVQRQNTKPTSRSARGTKGRMKRF